MPLPPRVQDVKTLRRDVKISFPDLSEDDLDLLLPAKAEVQLLKLKNKASVCRNSTLPSTALLQNTMQPFMCQRAALCGWHTASHGLFEVPGALEDAPDDAPTSSSPALAAA